MHIFFLNGPDKKAKENISKTKQQEAKSVRQQTATSQQDVFWRIVTGTLHWLASLQFLLFFLAFDWLSPAVRFFLN